MKFYEFFGIQLSLNTVKASFHRDDIQHKLPTEFFHFLIFYFFHHRSWSIIFLLKITSEVGKSTVPNVPLSHVIENKIKSWARGLSNGTPNSNSIPNSNFKLISLSL